MRKYKKRKVQYKKSSDWKLIGALFILLVISLVVFRKYYFLGLIDSSLNGSETKERTQHTIPQDVQKEIEKQKKLYSLTEIPNYRVPILMYHYVEYVRDSNDKTRISLNTLPLILDEQIKTLKQDGYTFMTAGELADVFSGKRELPKKPIILTFDDGYKDFYTDAYPILKKYHAKATQYVITGFLDHPNHLLTSELLEISKDGLVEIGAHTVTHIWMRDKLPAETLYQASESKKVLEHMTGKKITSFAYPFGAFDNPAVLSVEKAGFSNAVSTVPGIKQSFFQRFFLYRLRPGTRIGSELLTWLSQTKFKSF